ncbi:MULTISPECIES: DUF2783 domain-containing protein [Sulfitobacter]|jgi:hypothetical protein|uniref:DUF2783 domain-containing protein n=1 Tax=Sulfitobacter profundi TaxID=2679961 RepID=A0ABW1YW48_9RHOB|nr:MULTISPECIES: DUF2783 domain-containing protein [Sulfitobacter]UWR37226.1 DUF2783 domain-containing protein [Sulfitobacter sp. W074]|tara:strand:- start:2156 stop:2344 length:189 start_codon:yes stop_codon:yes gene_type:complete
MILQDNLGAEGDTVYAALMAAHEGLSEAESHALNARLVLMLANEVGDPARLETLFKAARDLA